MSTHNATIQTIAISIVFFLTLFIISSENLFTNQRILKFEPSLQVFIALIPLIIWLIVSGKLKEISGPSGIKLSIRDEIQKPVSLEITDKILEVCPAIVEEKGWIDKLQNRISQNPPTTLSFEVGKKNYYEHFAIEQYIRELEKYGAFQTILFTDANGKFEGCMKVNDYKTLIQTEDIVQKLESGQILKDCNVIRNSLGITSTNKQALNEMDKSNVNTLPVVNQEGIFMGVVTQEEVIRKILTKVFREA